MFNVEVDEQTELSTAEFEIREQLGFVQRNTSLGFAAEETAVELARFMIAREQIQEFRLEFKAKVRSSCALE